MSELAPTTLQECSRRSSPGHTRVSRDRLRVVSRSQPTSTERIRTLTILGSASGEPVGGPSATLRQRVQWGDEA